MLCDLIISASGWRKVFAVSGDENDYSAEIGEKNGNLCRQAAFAFFEFVQKSSGKKNPAIVLGCDTRPTSEKICEWILDAFLECEADIRFLGISAAPEIMAFSKMCDGFLYVSASHNPIGHNGLKFGLCGGGVLTAKENSLLKEIFENRLSALTQNQSSKSNLKNCEIKKNALQKIIENQNQHKNNALKSYQELLDESVSAEKSKIAQNSFFSQISQAAKENPVAIVCDFNGSARAASLDKKYFSNLGIKFFAINDEPKKIVHGIIPEGENLKFVAKEAEKIYEKLNGKKSCEKKSEKSNGENLNRKKTAVFGYMPDCDGDRGNLVFVEDSGKARILQAQELFALSVLSETAFLRQKNPDQKIAVVANCATSMRAKIVAEILGAEFFVGEVGESNVVRLSEEKRREGFCVRICGEGSNGGTIIFPFCVRDPINAIFSVLKLLLLKKNGLFEFWLESLKNYKKSKWITNLSQKKFEDFSLEDILKTLPPYKTTEVTDSLALVKVKEQNVTKLKSRFQKIFWHEWQEKKSELKKNLGILKWQAFSSIGTCEKICSKDFSASGDGGLKIVFYDENDALFFLWMRKSKTEPIFRIECDIKSANSKIERDLLFWLRKMIERADSDSDLDLDSEEISL